MQTAVSAAKPSLLQFTFIASYKGLKLAFLAATYYLLALILFFVFTNLAGGPSSSLFMLLMVLGYGLAIGMLPAIIIGSLSGGLLGALVYYTHTRLPKIVIICLAYLIAISLFLLIILIVQRITLISLSYLSNYFIIPVLIYLVMIGIYSAKAYNQLKAYE
jgi:hypothetical protein